jgi:hypothetical protein
MLNRVDCICRRCSFVASLLLVALACPGCNSKSGTAQVRGTVELDGKPLASGAIATIPQSGRGAKATIENGQFVLGTFAENDGALLGTHQVAVVVYEKSTGVGAEAAAGKLLIPERYTNPQTSGLTIDVTASGPNEPVLKLTSQP